ncbi:exosome non-catalytic core subunit rrp40, variant 2 [Entomophthora muscae]|uniref:Exosome non-catalytic core subunit rrp40, variant 2 n=1 Tax=Entomophthora muscae TaxID=34485 RepID=A0ACC2U669_9FUNG|nr:exosome non-catalytic core subunit rrp40, variant 2 [Entomophthora muscae]
MDEENQEIFEAKPTFVLPGDIVDPLKFYTQGENESNISSVDKVIKLGPGLIQREDSIIATAAGMLQHNYKDNRFWVDFNSKRYVPSTGDSVIGVVSKKFAESFSVDVGASVSASLSAYAFEGATKRNRPAVNVGDLVYVKVTLAHKDIEPEVEAVNSHTGRSEGFGPLKNGFAFKCSIGLCRRLVLSWTVFASFSNAIS